MNSVWIYFWGLMLVASVGWYGFLVFYVGAKGAQDIRRMVASLKKRDAAGRVKPSSMK